MYTLLLVVLSCFLYQIAADVKLNNKLFSKDFKFGVGSSAYQIEGAWDENGKGESAWDVFTHQSPSPIPNGDTGDIACDSHHNYKEDVARLVELGVTHYKFSLSWTRLIHNGSNDDFDYEMVLYYRNFLQLLQANGIEPIVSLFHFDTPQALEELGGWTNRDMINWFDGYTDLCFTFFGRYVKYWITFSEPRTLCQYGYGSGKIAPARNSPGEDEYLCLNNVLLAHGVTYFNYFNFYSARQNGKVSIGIEAPWYQPANADLKEDQEAAERMLQFTFGLFANPLFYGDYPDIVKEKIKERSLAQGYSTSRLPEFTENEKGYLVKTLDFISISTYSTYLARPLQTPNPNGKGLFEDAEVETFVSEDWEIPEAGYETVTPWGIGELLRWIKKNYVNKPILIIDNGYPGFKGTNDSKRISYLQSYISSVKDAIDNDNVNVIGYTVRSFLDSFEWEHGYSVNYGLYDVDFNSPDRKRTPKESAKFYKKLIETRCLVDKCVDQ